MLPADSEILPDTEVPADTGQRPDAAILHPDFGQQQRDKAAQLAGLLAVNATRFADEVSAIQNTLSPDAADIQASTARHLAEAMTGLASEMASLGADHQFPLGLKMSYAQARGEISSSLQAAQQIMSSLGNSPRYAEDLSALATAASQLKAAVADLSAVLGPDP